jgi:hypothetical protein
MGEQSPCAVPANSAHFKLRFDYEHSTVVETHLALDKAKPESGTFVLTNSSEDAKVKLVRGALDERTKRDLEKADVVMADYKKEADDAKDKSSSGFELEVKIKGIAERAKEKINKIVDDTTDWFTTHIRKLGLSDAKVEQVVGWWEGAWDIVCNAFMVVVDAIKWVLKKIAQAWESMKEFVKEAYNNVKKFISDALTAVSNFFKNL